MSQTKKQLDPLRFLRPIKRSSSLSKYSSQQSSQNISKSQLNIPFITSNSHKIQTELIQLNPYNPSKYFSQEIQIYLRNYKQNQISPTQEAKPQSTINRQKNQKVEKVEKVGVNIFLKQTFAKTTFRQEEAKNTNIQIQNRRQDNEQYQDKEQFDQQQNQLIQCQICNRKFNKQSHPKHIRICEKVFMKKRKPFKSIEQRKSTSKQKK